MCAPSVLWMRTDWPPSMVRARSPTWRRRAERCWSQWVQLRAESQLRQDENLHYLSLSISLAVSPLSLSLSPSASLAHFSLTLPHLTSYSISIENAPLRHRLTTALHQLVPRQTGGVDIWQQVNRRLSVRLFSLSLFLSLVRFSLSSCLSLLLSPGANPSPLLSRV